MLSLEPDPSRYRENSGCRTTHPLFRASALSAKALAWIELRAVLAPVVQPRGASSLLL
jgi:hypothetical protein